MSNNAWLALRLIMGSAGIPCIVLVFAVMHGAGVAVILSLLVVLLLAVAWFAALIYTYVRVS